MKKISRLILALDETEGKKALEIAKKLSAVVDAIKLGYPLVLSSGINIIKEISKLTYVLCDFKIADIPNTNLLIMKQAFDKGAGGIIVHGFVGTDSVKACTEGAKLIGKDVFIVTEMSNEGALQYLKPISNELAKLAVKLGATGIIAPGNRPDRIRELRSIVGSLLILCPGIGAQGGDAKSAISAGADYVIVGRSIYLADDPKKAAIEIINEIKGSSQVATQ
ncbi:MAG: orotidine-5'-phosphate decarboxylase [Candidatus Thermoplasmatota archaeon]|nr:orotidine-5'-phosphate decarboxylase [Candidatus Thermoplasmatota archaeon]